MLPSYDRFFEALCRAYDMWDDDINFQPFFRTMRQVMDDEIRVPYLYDLLNQIVDGLCNKIGKDEIISLVDQLVWERAGVDMDFCAYIAILFDSPHILILEVKPIKALYNICAPTA